MSELTQAAVKAATAEAHYARALQREFPHIAFPDHTKHLLVLDEALRLGKVDSIGLVDARIEALNLLAAANARVVALEAEVSKSKAEVERETERCAGIVHEILRHNADLHETMKAAKLAPEARMADGVRQVCERIEAAIRARPL